IPAGHYSAGVVGLRCPLLALSGHSRLHRTCPLSRIKRTSLSPPNKASARRNEPCRRHAFGLGVCNAQSPPADPAAEYRRHSVQLNSVFDIGPSVRISRTTGARCWRDIHEAAMSRSWHNGTRLRTRNGVFGFGATMNSDTRIILISLIAMSAAFT